MKHLPLHTLLLLGTFLHSGSCSGGVCRSVYMSVPVGGSVTIKCNITNANQDGVYTYMQQNNEQKTVLYYYKDGTLTLEEPYTGRVETNKNLGDFSVSFHNVSEQDQGIYWCKFNQFSTYTYSDRTSVFVQPVRYERYAVECEERNVIIYFGVISLLSFTILVLVAVLMKLCHERGNYRPQHQTPSNGVYEVMRGHTAKALINPAYESSRRRTPSDSN